MQSEGRGHNRRVCARPSKITSASRGVISDRVESSAQGNRTHFTLPIPLPLTMSLAEPEDLSVVFEVPLCSTHPVSSVSYATCTRLPGWLPKIQASPWLCPHRLCVCPSLSAQAASASQQIPRRAPKSSLPPDRDPSCAGGLPAALARLR